MVVFVGLSAAGMISVSLIMTVLQGVVIMSIRNEIKAKLVEEGVTMQEVLNRLKKRYCWSNSISNLSGKLGRESLRFKEVYISITQIIATMLGVTDKYVKEFSDQSQFIIISHRSGTMEQCDVLYGATMQQKGVTKLVSVMLEDALKDIE